MKITLYVPDAALPKEFSTEKCAQFRKWARRQIGHAFHQAQVDVTDDTMLDPGYQGVVVENGTQHDTFMVNSFCVDLVWGFEELEKPPQPLVGRQSFAGSFFKWADA